MWLGLRLMIYPFLLEGFNMKKLLLVISLFLAPLPLNAGIQNGITIPDSIELYNNSNESVEINGSTIRSKSSITIDSLDKGSIVIKQGKRKYQVSFPTYTHSSPISETFTQASLDMSTIQWLVGDINRLFPKGLDSIAITNDTYYPIAAIFVLSSMRCPSRRIEAQETISKVVSTQDNQKTGFLELIDGDRKKQTFSFPRRVYTRNGMHTADWHEITLRAETISWFSKGFKVSVK